MAKKKKKSLRKIMRFCGVALLVIGISASFVGAWWVSGWIFDAYGFDITKYKMDIASIVYGKNAAGETVEYEQLHYDTRRVWVSLKKIPESVQNAAVAIEDERFYQHQGMDLKRTAGAVLGFITGNAEYGGSTITQQLIKNITNEREGTAERKAKEIFRALVLETQMDKKEILEYYLNIVYFGSGCNGVQMAAHTYFDKDVSQLTLAESAAIVGITKSPTALNPFKHPEANKARQEVILNKMCELGYITEQERDEAIAEKLNFVDVGSEVVYSGVNSYFTEAMIAEVAQDLAQAENITLEQARRMVYTGGLKIYSTVEVDVQKAAEKAMDDTNTKIFPKLAGDVQPQAGLVIITPEDGAVRAIVGGVGRKKESLILNRAVDTTRQPGSSIKPLAAYGPAVELDLLSPGSVIIDEQFEYNGWKPKNWYSGFKGPVTMREAVVQSMNIPAIKTVQMVGVNTSFDFLQNKLGISTLDSVNDKNLAPLSLGGLSQGVTVLDITAAYGAFANEGVYNEPYMYTKVFDRKGNVLLDKETTSRRVFSKETASIMTSVLKSTAEGSLGISASLKSMVSAGKTGTTNDDKDRWYIGYTPYYLGGVWYGYDVQKTLPYSATRVVPHKIWQAVMTDIHKNLESVPFKSSGNIRKVAVCTQTGLLAGETCTASVEEFKKNNVPKAYCEGHELESESPAPTESGAPESPGPDGSGAPSDEPSPTAPPNAGTTIIIPTTPQPSPAA